MKKNKRIMALLIVMIMTMGLLAGCGGSKDADKSGDGASKGKLVKISMAHWDIDKSFPPGAEDAVYEKVKQDLNIEIEPQAVSWGDYRDKINVWAASGELPDIFSIDVVGTSTYTNWISNNLIRPLPEDLSKYPNLQKIVEVGDVEAYKVDGKNWFIPRANYPDPNWWANDRGVLVRKDWMEKLGIEDPKTDEEFIKMCVDFATKDPDGNGKDDTVGLTSLNAGFIWGTATNIAPDLSWSGWIKEDGKWAKTEVSQQSFNFYKFVRNLYNAGGLDKDFAVLKGDDAINKFGSGKAGALALQPAAKHVNKVYAVWNKLFPDKNFTDHIKILKERPDKNGDRWRFITASFWSESYINASVDDEKMDRILALYDYLMTPESKRMLLYGLEGVDYKLKDDGSIENLLGTKEDGTENTAGEKYPFLYSMSYLVTWGDEGQYEWTSIPKDIREMSKEHLDWSLENCKAPEIYWALSGLNTPTKDKVAFSGGDDLVQFVLSDKSEKEAWQEIIDKYNGQGYKKLQEEITAAAKDLGIK